MKIKPIIKMLIVSGLATAAVAGHSDPNHPSKPNHKPEYTRFEKQVMRPGNFAPASRFTQADRFKISGYLDSSTYHRKQSDTSRYYTQLRAMQLMVDSKLSDNMSARFNIDLAGGYNQAYLLHADPKQSPIYIKAGRYLPALGSYQGQWSANIDSPRYSMNNEFSVLRPDGVFTIGAVSANGFYTQAYLLRETPDQFYLTPDAYYSAYNTSLTTAPNAVEGDSEIALSRASKHLMFGGQVGLMGRQSGFCYDINMSGMNNTSLLLAQTGNTVSLFNERGAVEVTKDGAASANALYRVGSNLDSNDPLSEKAVAHFHVGGKMHGFGVGFDFTAPGKIAKTVQVSTMEGTKLKSYDGTSTSTATLYKHAGYYPTTQEAVTAYDPTGLDASVTEANIQTDDGVNQRSDSDSISTYMPKIWTVELNYSMPAWNKHHTFSGRYGATTKKDDAISQFAIKDTYTVGYEMGINKHVRFYANYTQQTALKQTVDLKTNAAVYTAPTVGAWGDAAVGNLGSAIASGKSTVTRSSGDKDKLVQLGVRVNL